ncbi:proton-conducting transporter transmembrane domain-containing protein [Calycomorphotria hydatis]|uniref:NADH-quinone oxidoreductase subunit 12 n=1 Tax=Calycomorphotria hydatis TaxID=2528027 RepID=A0A517T6U9_9PLAN|nr:proton-conducting transporter membrane subunit [Calycomorphotria hydatis]QDT64098.1 NADH-quinone oxidoreductase subunit 12 [Calycomorphotria hydatis]
MSIDNWFYLLGVSVVASPVVLLSVLGATSLAGRKISERASAKLTEASVVYGLISALAILVLMLVTGRRHIPIELGNWVVIPEQHFHFHIKFVFDRLSVPFTILSFVLCGTIGAFTSRYLHRESGYNRFFVLYAIFLLGMIVSSLAGTIETLFFGWEFVGLSSALLVAYFHERTNPVRNGQQVWVIYRIADAAFLIAALTLHHLTGAGDFEGLMGTGPWPEGNAAINEWQALSVGMLLLVAAAGKSALVPFSGWLPRAMEGPTPSSAIFYGALSVHLGAFLLLRVSPLLEASVPLCIAVVFVGLVSAIFGALAARVQTDIKSALAFASLTQVGIIIVEIGLGLRYLALIHIIGHACLRTLQLLRAPTLLHDYNSMENAIGGHLSHSKSILSRLLPASVIQWFYHVALERGFLDTILQAYFTHPFVSVFRWCDRMERHWTDFLSGEDSRESDVAKPQIESLEEFV